MSENFLLQAHTATCISYMMDPDFWQLT